MFPYDILLPPEAKYVGLVDKHNFNLNRDITWSFTFALTGQEHGFSTFLTTNPSLTGLPGHFIGGSSENDIPLHIAFDTTGYFGLSTITNTGIPVSALSSNALIIKNRDDVVLYQQLSSMSTDFFLTSAYPNYQTVRFHWANGDKIKIDYKLGDGEYQNLTTKKFDILIDPEIDVYCGFSFTTPVSSSSSDVSTLYFRNFHVKGDPSSATTEETTFTPISSSIPTIYTTLTGISAFR